MKMNKRSFMVGMASALIYRSSAAEPARTDLELRIDQVSSTGQLSVSLHNKGEAPLRMWRGGMMDIARWRVLHIPASTGHMKTYYQDPDQIFDARNNYRDLLPGKPWVNKLDLTSSFWLPNNAGQRGDNVWATTDTVIVFYDIPISDEGSKLGVWWGVVAAKAIVP